MGKDNSGNQEVCGCVNWARDGRDMFSPHHYHCGKYEQPSKDPRHARFGELVWNMIQEVGDDFFASEWSEDVMPLAERAGLCASMAYDPEIHGEMDAEPGDQVWIWTRE